MITVVTGFTKNYHYGYKFIETFCQYWPKEVELIVYTEEIIDIPRGHNLSLHLIPGYSDFMERNDKPIYNGLVKTNAWPFKEVKNYNYSFRTDARKFALQGFIPYDAAKYLETDYLIWMDADVITTRPVTMAFLDKLLDGKDLTFLGRRKAHSEIGFVAYKLPECDKIIERFHDYYNTDHLFSLREWHSAYVFDAARKCSTVQENNLTPNGRGHVWFQSPLGLYFDHQKGKRKDSGGSKEHWKWAESLQEQFGDYIC